MHSSRAVMRKKHCDCVGWLLLAGNRLAAIECSGKGRGNCSLQPSSGTAVHQRTASSAHSSWSTDMARGEPHIQGRLPLMRLESRDSTESCGKAPGVPHCAERVGVGRAEAWVLDAGGMAAAALAVAELQQVRQRREQGRRPPEGHSISMHAAPPHRLACAGRVPPRELLERRMTPRSRIDVSLAPHC
jgi:hypothetical protein